MVKVFILLITSLVLIDLSRDNNGQDMCEFDHLILILEVKIHHLLHLHSIDE